MKLKQVNNPVYLHSVFMDACARVFGIYKQKKNVVMLEFFFELQGLLNPLTLLCTLFSFFFSLDATPTLLL